MRFILAEENDTYIKLHGKNYKLFTNADAKIIGAVIAHGKLALRPTAMCDGVFIYAETERHLHSVIGYVKTDENTYCTVYGPNRLIVPAAIAVAITLLIGGGATLFSTLAMQPIPTSAKVLSSSSTVPASSVNSVASSENSITSYEHVTIVNDSYPTGESSESSTISSSTPISSEDSSATFANYEISRGEMDDDTLTLYFVKPIKCDDTMHITVGREGLIYGTSEDVNNGDTKAIIRGIYNFGGEKDYTCTCLADIFNSQHLITESFTVTVIRPLETQKPYVPGGDPNDGLPTYTPTWN